MALPSDNRLTGRVPQTLATNDPFRGLSDEQLALLVNQVQLENGVLQATAEFTEAVGTAIVETEEKIARLEAEAARFIPVAKQAQKDCDKEFLRWKKLTTDLLASAEQLEKKSADFLARVKKADASAQTILRDRKNWLAMIQGTNLWQ